MNNERGFTLLEIIITFILAAFVGSMLVEYMGTSLTRGGEAVVMVQDGFSLNSVMEKITADYEDNYKNGSLTDFQSKIQNGTAYYGNYTLVANECIYFNASNTEDGVGCESGNILKVTISVGNQSLTALFRK